MKKKFEIFQLDFLIDSLFEDDPAVVTSEELLNKKEIHIIAEEGKISI